MDTRLEKALAFSKYRATIENRRTALVRRLNAMFVTHYNNGMFNADQQTIAYVKALIDSGNEDAILLDVKNNPIQIGKLQEFLDLLLERHFAAMNEYADEMGKLAKARNVKKAMDWE